MQQLQNTGIMEKCAFCIGKFLCFVFFYYQISSLNMSKLIDVGNSLRFTSPLANIHLYKPLSDEHWCVWVNLVNSLPSWNNKFTQQVAMTLVFFSPQARLISLYFDTKCYQEALQLGEWSINLSELFFFFFFIYLAWKVQTNCKTRHLGMKT